MKRVYGTHNIMHLNYVRSNVTSTKITLLKVCKISSLYSHCHPDDENSIASKIAILIALE